MEAVSYNDGGVAGTRMSGMPYRRGVRHKVIRKRATIWGWLFRATLVLCAILLALFLASFFAPGASAQIAKMVNDDGRQFFENAEPLVTPKLTASRPRTNIYLPAETSFTGRSRPAMEMGRDGVEKLVREAADRHRVYPPLLRAVIEME